MSERQVQTSEDNSTMANAYAKNPNFSTLPSETVALFALDHLIRSDAVRQMRLQENKQ
jgi:hypothetical protein